MPSARWALPRTPPQSPAAIGGGYYAVFSEETGAIHLFRLSDARQWTIVRRAAAVLVTVGIALVGCDTNDCPVGWDPDVPQSEVSTGCGPPAGYEEAVRERIETGLFGHATYRRGENVGPGYSCEYENEGLAGPDVFEIAPYDELEGLGPSILVEVQHDGTWEVALLPGVEYHPLWQRGDASLGVDRREVSMTGNFIVLREGQVVLAHVVLSEC